MVIRWHPGGERHRRGWDRGNHGGASGDNGFGRGHSSSEGSALVDSEEAGRWGGLVLSALALGATGLEHWSADSEEAGGSGGLVPSALVSEATGLE